MIVCAYLMSGACLRLNQCPRSRREAGLKTGPQRCPVSSSGDLLLGVRFPECLDLCEDGELKLGKILAYDCLGLSLVGSVLKAKAENNSAASTRVATKSGRAGLACCWAVSDAYEALLLTGVSQTLGAENTAKRRPRGLTRVIRQVGVSCWGAPFSGKHSVGALEGSSEGLDLCEDMELSLGRILAYDCL